jgi:hypothetical protein
LSRVLSGDLSGAALAKTEVGTKTEAAAAKRDGYVFAKIRAIRVNFFVPDLRSSECCQAEVRLCGKEFVQFVSLFDPRKSLIIKCHQAQSSPVASDRVESEIKPPPAKPRSKAAATHRELFHRAADVRLAALRQTSHVRRFRAAAYPQFPSPIHQSMNPSIRVIRVNRGKNPVINTNKH